MKNQILKLVKARDFVSFAELKREIDGFEGTLAFSNEEMGDNNICIWFSCSQEGINAIFDLMDSKDIILEQASPTIYLIDGCMPTDPPTKDTTRKYEKPRWFPMVLRPASVV